MNNYTKLNCWEFEKINVVPLLPITYLNIGYNYFSSK